MRHKSNNKTRPLFTLSLEMTRLVNETRLLLVHCFNSDIYGILSIAKIRENYFLELANESKFMKYRALENNQLYGMTYVLV